MKNKDILLEHLHDMDEFAKMKGISCPPIYLIDSVIARTDFSDRVRELFIEIGLGGNGRKGWIPFPDEMLPDRKHCIVFRPSSETGRPETVI